MYLKLIFEAIQYLYPNVVLIMDVFFFYCFGLIGHKNGLPMTLFTQEDLLLYLYKESSPDLTVALETALKEDWMLREKLVILESILVGSGLSSEKFTFSPRTEVIQRVMNYARETSIESVQHS